MPLATTLIIPGKHHAAKDQRFTGFFTMKGTSNAAKRVEFQYEIPGMMMHMTFLIGYSIPLLVKVRHKIICERKLGRVNQLCYKEIALVP